MDYKNSKVQGTAGLGRAIAHFTGKGYSVSLPLTESQPYDLIVDIDGRLNRVEVKTSKWKRGITSWSVGLRTRGSNMGHYTSKDFDSDNCELLYVSCADGIDYLIPSKEIRGKTNINVGPDSYGNFRV